MQPQFSPEIINIIISVIIYLSAFSMLLKGLINRILTRQNAERAKELELASASGDGGQEIPARAADENKSESEGVKK